MTMIARQGPHSLASASGLSQGLIRAAIWESGFEDAGAVDAQAYLRGFGAAIGYDLSEAEWVSGCRGHPDTRSPVSNGPHPDRRHLCRIDQQ
jgi:formylglycine-generating enzyme required for sulfatase activity